MNIENRKKSKLASVNLLFILRDVDTAGHCLIKTSAINRA